MTASHGLPQETKSLTLDDLKETKPEYISNIAVNHWKKDKESVDNYEILTMSPSVIERLDYRQQEGRKQFEGLEPEDVKLSDAMATSAAAISSHMGKYDISVLGLTRFHTLLGLEMGARMISDIQAVKNEDVVCKVRWMTTCDVVINVTKLSGLMSTLFIHNNGYICCNFKYIYIYIDRQIGHRSLVVMFPTTRRAMACRNDTHTAVRCLIQVWSVKI